MIGVGEIAGFIRVIGVIGVAGGAQLIGASVILVIGERKAL